MKILFVLEYFHPHLGGVETLFKTLTDKLAKGNNQIAVITRRHKSDLPKKEESTCLKIFRYQFRNRYFFTFLALFPILTKIKDYDIVHTTSYNAALPAFIAAKMMGKPIIITFHEYWGDLWFKLPFMSRFSKYLHYSFEKMLVKLPFDCFVAVSKSTAESLLKAGVRKDKIKVIYNGIDYKEMEGFSENISNQKPAVFTLAYFGRLGISKGLDLLLEALKLLKEAAVDFQIKLITPKEPEEVFEYIQTFISEHSLSSNIEYKHYLPYKELVQEIQAVHGVIIPSYSEGFCFAAAECIALGIPIISSDQAALREVVSGKFIKMEGFSAKALAEAIKKAKEGKWEETPFKRFELSKTIEDYEELYKRF